MTDFSKDQTRLIGIGGTNGSGKDTLGKILSERHGYFFMSMTDMLREELKRQGKSLERENMRALSAEWRHEFGLSVLVDKVKTHYDELTNKDNYSGLAMASLRNPGEADAIHAHGGLVIWLDADPKLRYERIRANAQSRGQERQVDDDKSFEQFLAEEAAEMNRPKGGDAASLAMSEVKQKSDLIILNEGQDVDDLDKKIIAYLGF